MKIVEFLTVLFFITCAVVYIFYISPKNADDRVLSKISLSLSNGYYDEVCGIYKGSYEEYEKALRGNSDFFELDKNGKKFKFLVNNLRMKAIYQYKSESRFNGITELKVGQRVCVVYSTKYLEADKSYNYRQVPLLISVN